MRPRVRPLSAERAVVIGNGNVALDVARMLVLSTAELASTDIADHALEVLAQSSVREVVVVGRRGPAQAAFTNPELLELGELADADVIVDRDELELASRVRRSAEQPTRPRAQRRDPALLRRAPAGRARSPHRAALPALADRADAASEPPRRGRARAQRADRRRPTAACARRPDDERETIAAGLVFRAIGYRGVPLPRRAVRRAGGAYPQRDGRVLDPATGSPLPASMSWAGSSAARPASSAPTRRTRRRPSTRSSPTSPRARTAPPLPRAAGRRRRRGACCGSPARARHL